MKKGGKTKKQEQRGRPTKYKEAYAEEAYEFCLLGCTNEDLAEYFLVNIDTIYEWQKKHSEFSEAIKLGKKFADGKVAKSLYQRALGATIKQQKAFKVRDMEGNESIEVVSLDVEVPADVNAAKFWLTNRQGDKWKDKQEDLPTEEKKEEIDLSKLTKDELHQFIALRKKVESRTSEA